MKQELPNPSAGKRVHLGAHGSRFSLDEEGKGTLLARISSRLARTTSRRGLIALGGRAALGLAGFAVLPALPVTRTAHSNNQQPDTDARSPTAQRYAGKNPSDCFYWRYCNLHGTLCTGCPGGDILTCPPGSTPTTEFWVGCCTEPESGRTFLIAYIDCCGSSNCGDGCGEGWMQATPYDPRMDSQRNDVLWCQSDTSQAYTCTLAPVFGQDCSVEERR